MKIFNDIDKYTWHKLWKLICYYISGLEVFYTVILSNDLIKNKKWIQRYVKFNYIYAKS